MPSAQPSSTKVLTDKLKEIFSHGNFKSFEEFHVNVLPKSFEEFHVNVLEIIANYISGMPGIPYEAPNLQAVKERFSEWKKASEEEKMKVIEDLLPMTNPYRTATIVTGIVAPMAAMIVKRTAENVPILNVIKMVPDAVFVPFATVVALTSVRFFPKNALQKRKIKYRKA